MIYYILTGIILAAFYCYDQYKDDSQHDNIGFYDMDNKEVSIILAIVILSPTILMLAILMIIMLASLQLIYLITPKFRFRIKR